jgi:hypothetical protein
VVSVAVKVADPKEVELTVKVATPEASEDVEVGEMLSLPPLEEVSETVFPGTTFP